MTFSLFLFIRPFVGYWHGNRIHIHSSLTAIDGPFTETILLRLSNLPSRFGSQYRSFSTFDLRVGLNYSSEIAVKCAK